MPYILTHFYTASRIALDFENNNTFKPFGEIITDLTTGIKTWLEANETFHNSVSSAQKDKKKFQQAMDLYKKTLLENEQIAVFSAFAAGSQGPDLWTVLHSFWDATDGKITGSAYFDLGHYNLSHRFPIFALREIKKNYNSLPQLQLKYRIAYVLGYLSHIALDIHSHLMVNVFATAYFQTLKHWETEQASSSPLAIIETTDIFNNHNKIEQYFDVLLKFVCFEGYHDDITGYDDLLQAIGHPNKKWYFPNFSDYWDSRLDFGLITNGIDNDDEDFLDLSTSLAAPFAHHYTDKSSLSVTPFIREYMYNAYTTLDPKIKNDDELALVDLDDEEPKMHFFRFDNDWSPKSFYYNLKIAVPNKEKMLKNTRGFYEPKAFGSFIKGSIELGKTYIHSALMYLNSTTTNAETIKATSEIDDPDVKKYLHHLHNWNLDIGLSLRIRKGKKTPKGTPVLFDLISSLGYPVMKNWITPEMHYGPKNDKQTIGDWPIPVETAAPGAVYKTNIVVSHSSPMEINITPQAKIKVGISHNYLYYKNKNVIDPGEIGVYLFGSDERFTEDWVMDTEVKNEVKKEVLKAYKLENCFEDYTGPKIAISNRKNGNITLRDYQSEFCGSDLTEITNPESDKDPALLPQKKIIPRHVRVSLCRKWVCKSNDTVGDGAFNGDLQICYKTVFPSEEVAFSLFALHKDGSAYKDLFHDTTFTQNQIDNLKQIKVIGVNSVLLIFSIADDSEFYYDLTEAWIDGEQQDLTLTPDDDYYTIPDGQSPVPPIPPVPPIDDSCSKLELEDVMFRTDSAVFLPDGYNDRSVADMNQEAARGLKALSLVYSYAEKNPKHKLFITAHTDTVGNAKDNFDLSVDRANSVQYILENNRLKWAEIAVRRNHEKDIQTICKWFAAKKVWDCDPGEIDGIHGSNTLRAIKNLKTAFNSITDFGWKAKETPTLDKETWEVVFDLYQYELSTLMSTTYADICSKASSWATKWAIADRKSIGCCEAFPKDNPGVDNFESPINRRVEILFFGEKWHKDTLCDAVTTVSNVSIAEDRIDKCRNNCKIYTVLKDKFEYI
jgi:outer membrane protein OmpA-like peptidoglycan-associated protein